MSRTGSFQLATFAIALCLFATPAAARKKPPPEKAGEAQPSAAAEPSPPPLQNAAPSELPPPMMMGPGPAPAPMMVTPLPAAPPSLNAPRPRRRYWELAAIGGGLLGGAYLLQVLVGGLSYAGFYDGQWGWFVPIAGPAVVMSGASGDPLCCLTKGVYTYTLGPILSIITVAGLAMTLAGAIATKPVSGNVSEPQPPAQPPAFQFAPTAGPSSAGLIMLGSF